jgi:hypothetical protein
LPDRRIAGCWPFSCNKAYKYYGEWPLKIPAGWKGMEWSWKS